jgi:hypothetical protein
MTGRLRSMLRISARAAGVAAWLFAQPAFAQLVVWQSGYQTIPVDAFQAVTHSGIACSPGGEWGDYVYVSNRHGKIQRVDENDVVTTLATGVHDRGGIAFGPGPASSFEDALYVAAGGQLNEVTLSGQVSNLLPPHSGSFRDVEFDASGTYGTDLFITDRYDGPLRTVDSTGSLTFFSLFDANYVKFGPGGVWGTGMYATGYSNTAQSGVATVNTSGVATSFSTFGSTAFGFDWAFGPGWDGDMFVAAYGSSFEDSGIYRVKPDGSSKLFARVFTFFPADVAFCNDALYVAADGIYKIVPFTPVPAMHPLALAALSSVLGGTAVRALRRGRRG